MCFRFVFYSLALIDEGLAEGNVQAEEPMDSMKGVSVEARLSRDGNEHKVIRPTLQ